MREFYITHRKLIGLEDGDASVGHVVRKSGSLTNPLAPSTDQPLTSTSAQSLSPPANVCRLYLMLCCTSDSGCRKQRDIVCNKQQPPPPKDKELTGLLLPEAERVCRPIRASAQYFVRTYAIIVEGAQGTPFSKNICG